MSTENQLWITRADPERPGGFMADAALRGGKRVVLRCGNKEALDHELIRMQLCLADDGEDRFLHAWKRGVKFMPHLFHCDAETIDAATDKNQLRPDWDAVETFLQSRPEPWARKLVMALCSFYNDDWMHDWAKKLRLPRSSPGDLAIRLDTDHREVIADLLVSYRGW